MSSLDKLLKTLSEAPASEIDAVLAKRIKGLIGGNVELVRVELKEILDDAATESLASDFAINILEHAWFSVGGKK
jgi:hypothetical protein